jgi:hypothetical protein
MHIIKTSTQYDSIACYPISSYGFWKW